MEIVKSKSKQGNTIMKTELLTCDSNSCHTAYEADALPNDLLRQLSWLGQIRQYKGKPVKLNLDKQENSNSTYTPDLLFQIPILNGT